jgi:hypothetical protein
MLGFAIVVMNRYWGLQTFLSLQKVYPEPPFFSSGIVAAYRSSNYCTKYNCKADATKENEATLLEAQKRQDHLLQTSKKVLDDDQFSPEMKAKKMLAKCQNYINGSYTVALVMVASYLLGYGDYWFPMKTVPYDHNWFKTVFMEQKQRPGGVDDLIEQETMFVLEPDIENSSVRVGHRNDTYTWRPDELGQYSAFELAMLYNVGKITSASRLIVKSGCPLIGRCYQPRRSIVIPQFFKMAPICPSEEASVEEKDAWASFAFGNFFPFDISSYWDQLQGDSLWDKYLFWKQERPRGDLDNIAHRILGNIQARCLANLEMKQEEKTTKIRRRDMLALVARSKHKRQKVCTRRVVA